MEANVISLIGAGANVTEDVIDGGKTALHSGTLIYSRTCPCQVCSPFFLFLFYVAVEKGAPLAVVKHLLLYIRDGIYDYEGGPFYCFKEALPIHLAMKNPGISSLKF